MSKLSTYALHAASGQPRVWLGGKSHYLGVYDSPESRIKYAELLKRYSGGPPVDPIAPSPGSDDPGPTVNVIAAAFPKHAEVYYVTSGEQTPEELHKHQDWYWNSEHVNGAIPICHLGCNLRQLLIVTGPERNHIWFDDRADCEGLYPDSKNNSKRVSFFEWYRKWADDKLQTVT